MTRFTPRSSFNSPRLIRLLADLATEDFATPKQSFAERLGHWLDLTGAIALSGALTPLTGSAADARFRTPSSTGEPLREEFARLRAAIADAIATNGSAGPGKARIRLPSPKPGEIAGIAPDYVPYRRYYAAHQRDMEAAIAPLRARVRQALTAGSSALGQLAGIDAVMEKTLGGHERESLATVPWLLEKHFERLWQRHRQALIDTHQPDDPAQWMQSGGWLAVFCYDLQAVLLAELDVRLQPVAGLIEALDHESPRETSASFPHSERGQTRSGQHFVS